REEMTLMEQIGNEVRATESGTLDPALRAKILTNIADEAATVPPPATGASSGQPRRPLPRLPQLNLLQWGVAATAILIVGAMIYPTTQRGRENALRATSQSNMKRLAPAFVPDAQYDSASAPEAAGAHSPANSPAPPAMRSVTNWDYKANSARGEHERQTVSQSNMKPLGLAAKSAAPRPGYSGSTAPTILPSTLRRVHKEARVTVEVKELEEQSNAVESMVKSANGFVVSNALSTGGDGVKTAALDIKVPVKHFETVLAQISRLGEVKAKNVSGEDITEQISDAQAADNVLSSELSVKEAMLKEARLKAAKKKNVVPDDWQQRAEVRRLRIEAAQIRARLELLRRTSDLSNISVQLQQPPHIPGQGGFLEDISETGHTAFESFLVAARLPINLLIWILAYSPLWIPLLIAYQYASRVYGRRTPPP
ncbi:MAG TPA: DUF4349 domain-containing protein, partial [Abditibacteriaceae bacterium]|nr:DUF4349 domain-containing protein [Abditibacteriaceae bacterium]